MPQRSKLALLLLAGLLSSVACDDPVEPSGPELKMQRRIADLIAADDHSFDDPPPTRSDDCDVTLSPTGNNAATINTAVDGARSWDVICLSAGYYDMDAPIVVSFASNLTIKGLGATPEDTILDYAAARSGKGIDAFTPGFWIENLYIKNTVGNGVEVKANNTADAPNVFRKLKVDWDRGPDTANGSYSVYPTRSKYVVVEFCEVEGASDAGVYVGQVEYGIIRHNYVHSNVAGLEVENSKDVVVYDNEVTDNTGGILALQEDRLNRQVNGNVLIRDNHVYANNRENFASANTAVANVQRGTGLMAFAGNGIEFRDNLVEDNDSVAVLIVSNVTLRLIENLSNPNYVFEDGYDPVAQNIGLSGNTFTGNGGDPTDLLKLATGQSTLPDVLYDGVMDNWVETTADPPPDPITPPTDPNVCIGATGPPTSLILDMNTLSGGDLQSFAFSIECDAVPISVPTFPSP